MWDLALFGRHMGARTRMVYWADILHKKESRTSKRVASSRLTAEDLLDGIKLPRGTRTAALAFAESLATSVAGRTTGDRSKSIGKRVLPLPGFLRKPIARRFMKWFIKDTAAYFFDDGVREEIHRRLAGAIVDADEPFVLVSHSQGTVAAYEVLHAIADRPEAALFATLGSPLGLQEVQDLLLEERDALEVPPDVRAWHNFADPLDPVALDKTLRREFEPVDSVHVHDQVVVNERTKELVRFNPHSSLGYLANLSVRQVIHHASRFDPAGRFIVARDVSERLVDPERRQPVLIEVLHPGYWATGETYAAMESREKDQSASLATLHGRVKHLAKSIRAEVRGERTATEAKRDVSDARILPLRKYVAAHLTSTEIVRLSRRHREVGIYSVWRSSEKRKLLGRSHAPLKVDAARQSYAAQGKGVVWAVLDTGVMKDHPHFKEHSTIVELYDCTTNHAGPRRITKKNAMDPDGHGTHVAGIIAGEHDALNGGFSGVAPKTKLVVYKVLDDDGFGEDAWIIKAIDDIYRRNDAGVGLAIHGVNLSLGGTFDPTVYGCGYSPICKELRDLWRQGSVVCVAAGNEGKLSVLTHDGSVDLNTQMSVGDPANLEDCIAVGSVNADKPHLYGVSHFSSRGPTADGRAKPDVVAPGERIQSCNAAFGGSQEPDFKSLYRADSGTSMACPHVSGLIAAFLSVRREFIGHPDRVKSILLENCNDLGRDRYHQGSGLPNLMKMLMNT